MDVAFRRIARGQTMTDKIKISNLYKVFGKNPTGAMDHVRKGASKQELLDNHLPIGIPESYMLRFAGGFRAPEWASGS